MDTGYGTEQVTAGPTVGITRKFLHLSKLQEREKMSGGGEGGGGGITEQKEQAQTVHVRINADVHITTHFMMC